MEPSTIINDSEIYLQQPNDFIPQASIVACYLENDGKILLLKKASAQNNTNLWDVPTGTLNNDEPPLTAVLRETYKETGIWLTEKEITLLEKLFIKTPQMDHSYYMFKAQLPKFCNIKLSAKKYQDYKWATYNDAIKLPLVDKTKKTLMRYKALTKNVIRKKTVMSVYLILQKNNQVLLHLRNNTGYEDGKFGLVAGHVEGDESATQAMVREAYEEAGIHILESDLKCTHIMHRKENRENLDLFFTCNNWQREVTNKEPDKCDELKFYPLDKLPSNLITYVEQAIAYAKENIVYSEQGWDNTAKT